MRTYDNARLSPILASGSMSGSICLSFAVKYQAVGIPVEPQPEILVISDGINIGELNLTAKANTWMNAQVQLQSTSNSYSFDLYLTGENYSVSVDNISLSTSDCIDLPGM